MSPLFSAHFSPRAGHPTHKWIPFDHFTARRTHTVLTILTKSCRCPRFLLKNFLRGNHVANTTCYPWSSSWFVPEAFPTWSTSGRTAARHKTRACLSFLAHSILYRSNAAYHLKVCFTLSLLLLLLLLLPLFNLILQILLSRFDLDQNKEAQETPFQFSLRTIRRTHPGSQDQPGPAPSCRPQLARITRRIGLFSNIILYFCGR